MREIGFRQDQRKHFKKSTAFAMLHAIFGMKSARVAPQQSSKFSSLTGILLEKELKINKSIFSQICNKFLTKNVLDLGSTIKFLI